MQFQSFQCEYSSADVVFYDSQFHLYSSMNPLSSLKTNNNYKLAVCPVNSNTTLMIF